jgi:AcrR family transcriptional regulator
MAVSKGEHTRRKIVGRALALAGETGLDGLSLGVLAEDTRLSKSGLFAHFRSKEALQLGVLQAMTERFTDQVIRPALLAPRGEPRLRLLFERNVEWIRGSEGRRGCLLQKLASEYADRPGPLRDRVAEAMRAWHEVVARTARGAVESGAFRAGLDAAAFADQFLGLAMMFQQHHRLLRDRVAEKRVVAAFDALLRRSRAQRRH